MQPISKILSMERSRYLNLIIDLCLPYKDSGAEILKQELQIVVL